MTVKCPTCKKAREDWCSYFCPLCGEHHDDLYRREHHDGAKARTLTRSQIRAEYTRAGRRYERQECLWPSRQR